MKEKREIAKFFPFQTKEKEIYERWTKKACFQPKMDKEKPCFSITLPPPNITSQLHLGHALDQTYPDILIRYKRMQGYNALCLPGTDHASIATEAKIVQSLREEGIDKESLGREDFLKRAWEWKEKYSKRITDQMKSLGVSSDWSRERFTMDEGLSKAVNHVFVKLYNKGLIYRGEKLINWCPCCKTSISDAEVEYKEEASYLWHLRYPLLALGEEDIEGRTKHENTSSDDKISKEYLVLATTRPETMLGDVAVAVNPEDERYKHLIGRKLLLPLKNKEIPIIADNYVDPSFGTGVVKITPAHDPNDYEVGKRHGLPMINVFTEDGHINEEGGRYEGLSLKEARQKIVADLEALDLVEKIEEHKHNVGTCYRCSTTIEPRLSKQWFVKMKDLAVPAIEAVKSKEIRFTPERFEKIYYNWMENIKDWCISRQLWWGHRIPAYYNDNTGEIFVSETELKVDPKTGEALRQDEDTLDTWFSSALWPFSTLHWPDTKHEDYQSFYPTSVMVTGYDILFFWVARMIFSGLEYTGQIPFKDVIFHGLVRDEHGRKMSKSLGNGVDPEEIIHAYGTDVLRYALIDGVSTGNDMRFQKEKLEAAKSFVTKIWNAFKFVHTYLEEDLDFSQVEESNYTLEDRWILSEWNHTLQTVERNLAKYEFGVALSNIVSFIWDSFCDWSIEMAKPRLYDQTAKGRLEAIYLLKNLLGKAMKVLHPFMPFVTTEIYSHLYDEELMESQWPELEEKWIDEKTERNMKRLQDTIKAIRSIRLSLQVPNQQKTQLLLLCAEKEVGTFFTEALPYLQRLANISSIRLLDSREEVPAKVSSGVFDGGEFFIPMEELVDAEKEMQRLQKEKEKCEQELLRVRKKLANEDFVRKAPEQVIRIEKEKEEKFAKLLLSVQEQMDAL